MNTSKAIRSQSRYCPICGNAHNGRNDTERGPLVDVEYQKVNRKGGVVTYIVKAHKSCVRAD